MAGWSHQKRVAFEQAFYAFLSQCHINSKDDAFISLGDNIYYGQRLFITAIMDGLEKDIHDFYCLKSRQLGITTICRALSTFYLGVHRGLSGALGVRFQREQEPGACRVDDDDRRFAGGAEVSRRSRRAAITGTG